MQNLYRDEPINREELALRSMRDLLALATQYRSELANVTALSEDLQEEVAIQQKQLSDLTETCLEMAMRRSQFLDQLNRLIADSIKDNTVSLEGFRKKLAAITVAEDDRDPREIAQGIAETNGQTDVKQVGPCP